MRTHYGAFLLGHWHDRDHLTWVAFGEARFTYVAAAIALLWITWSWASTIRALSSGVRLFVPRAAQFVEGRVVPIGADPCVFERTIEQKRTWNPLRAPLVTFWREVGRSESVRPFIVRETSGREWLVEVGSETRVAARLVTRNRVGSNRVRVARIETGDWVIVWGEKSSDQVDHTYRSGGEHDLRRLRETAKLPVLISGPGPNLTSFITRTRWGGGLFTAFIASFMASLQVGAITLLSMPWVGEGDGWERLAGLAFIAVICGAILLFASMLLTAVCEARLILRRADRGDEL